MKATTKITEKEQTIIKIVKVKTVNLEMTEREAHLLGCLMTKTKFVDAMNILNCNHNFVEFKEVERLLCDIASELCHSIK